MWEVLPSRFPLSLLIFQPNVHIQQFCLAGNRNISGSQRLLSWQLRLEHGVGSPVFVFFSLPSHREKWVRDGRIKLFIYMQHIFRQGSYEFHKWKANKSQWGWQGEQRELRTTPTLAAGAGAEVLLGGAWNLQCWPFSLRWDAGSGSQTLFFSPVLPPNDLRIVSSLTPKEGNFLA